MKKALIVTSIAFVLLLAVVAAGLNVVFTVTYIEASFSTYSLQGEEDAKSLKAELDKFVGASTTFLDLDDVKAKVKKYPAFRLESIQKKFPKTVSITLEERKELFAYEMTDGKYAIIDDEGVCMALRDDNVSRTGGENILLTDFALTVTVGAPVEGAYVEALFSVFKGLGETMTDARSNVREVTLNIAGSASNPLTHLFEIEMQEGVMIKMSNPLSNAEEKAKKAMEIYNDLGDIQKMYGTITVTDSREPGQINADYDERG